jgi:hypothetical protein
VTDTEAGASTQILASSVNAGVVFCMVAVLSTGYSLFSGTHGGSFAGGEPVKLSEMTRAS